MKRAIALDFICYAIVMLLVYAALSKLFLFDIYIYDLKRSPFIGDYASYLSLTLPTIELAVAIMLLFLRTRYWALWGALVLMIAFTIYVALIIGLVDSRPCTCGGLIRQLTWKQHLVFNIFYTGLVAVGIWLHKNLYSQWKPN